MKKGYKVFVSSILITILLTSVFMFAACGGEDKIILEEDITYYLDSENSTLLGLPLFLIAEDTSSITLRADGSATMKLDIHPGINTLLSSLKILDMIEGVDVDEMLWYLPSVFFPGNTIAHLENLFKAAKESLGLSINGIDFQDSEMKPVFEELAETGKMPGGFRLPERLSIEYNADYHIVELESSESKKFTAAYLGSHGENGEPFMILTLFDDPETGEKRISFSIDFIKLNILAVKQ